MHLGQCTQILPSLKAVQDDNAESYFPIASLAIVANCMFDVPS
jgi:hypothetical protein